MFKLTETTDLEKAGLSIGSFFAKQAEELEKNFAFHKACAVVHEAKKAAHDEMHTAHKAHAESLGKEDPHHAHFHKMAAHHATMAGHEGTQAATHNAEADKCKTQVDAMKALAAEWGVSKASGGPITAIIGGKTLELPALSGGGTGNPIQDMVSATSQHLMKKTLEMMDSDPGTMDWMRQTVTKMVAEAIGNTVAPPAVSKVAPTAPTLVPRPGQPAAGDKKTPVVPLEFAKLVAVDEDDDRLS